MVHNPSVSNPREEKVEKVKEDEDEWEEEEEKEKGKEEEKLVSKDYLNNLKKCRTKQR